jgi:hypothetical protein
MQRGIHAKGIKGLSAKVNNAQERKNRGCPDETASVIY